LEDPAETACGNGVDKGSDEQLNRVPAMNGNESTGKRMDIPPLALGFIAPLTIQLHQILSSHAREKCER
jgi:hypothetical protein